jgi:hypothetical protein
MPFPSYANQIARVGQFPQPLEVGDIDGFVDFYVYVRGIDSNDFTDLSFMSLSSTDLATEYFRFSFGNTHGSIVMLNGS